MITEFSMRILQKTLVSSSLVGMAPVHCQSGQVGPLAVSMTMWLRSCVPGSANLALHSTPRLAPVSPIESGTPLRSTEASRVPSVTASRLISASRLSLRKTCPIRTYLKRSRQTFFSAERKKSPECPRRPSAKACSRATVRR